MANFLSIAPLQHEGRGFKGYQQKSSKGFFSQTMQYVNYRSSRSNSPGEALQIGASSVALQPPVAEEFSEITDTHT